MFPDLLCNRWACHSFMVAGGRQEIPRSVTKVFYYSEGCCQSFSTLPQVPEPQLPQGDAGLPGRKPTHSRILYRERTWRLGNALLCSSLWTSLLFVPEGQSISSPRAAPCKYNPEKWLEKGAVRASHSWHAQEDMLGAWETHGGVILNAVLAPILWMGKLRPRKIK